MFTLARILIIAAVIMTIPKASMQAQEMNVLFRDGSNERFNISSIRNMSHQQDQMVIVMNDGMTVSIPLSIIRRVNYDKSAVNLRPGGTPPPTLHLYPNPVKTVLNIRLPEQTYGQALLEITGRDGQQVHVELLLMDKNNPVITWQVPDHLASSLYVCRLSTSEYQTSCLFIIQH